MNVANQDLSKGPAPLTTCGIEVSALAERFSFLPYMGFQQLMVS